MIHLTRLNHLPLVLNADLIESIEVTPDTVIALTTGQKLVVLEPVEEVVRRVVEFRRAIYNGILFVDPLAGTGQPRALHDEVLDNVGNRTEHGRDKRSCT